MPLQHSDCVHPEYPRMPFGKLFAALKGNHRAAEEQKPVKEEPVKEEPVKEEPASEAPVEDSVAQPEAPPEPKQAPTQEQEEEKEEEDEDEEETTEEEIEEDVSPEEDEHDKLEKAIFDSGGGFGDDWTEEADWGSTPAPAELENEDGWTMKKPKIHTKSKRTKGRKYQGSQKPKPVVKKEEEKKPEQSIVHPTSMHALLATMDVEDELGIELAASDSEDEEVEQQHVEEPAVDVVPESKPKAPVTLSKKEKQELKKKELEDLDAMLAELGVDTQATTDKTASKEESSKAAKRRAKKERKAVNGTAQVSDNTQEQSAASSDADGASGPAIDPNAVKAAKTALKKKPAPKKVSAAQAAAKAAASKGKKKSKDTSKFNELYGR